jgi:subtilase family serine protease
MRESLEEYIIAFLETYYEDANYNIAEDEKDKIIEKCIEEIQKQIDDIIIKNLK